MLEVIKLIVTFILCSTVQGKLVQVKGNREFCFEDMLEFWCSTDDFPLINWDIEGLSDRVTFHFGAEDPVGTTNNWTISSSRIYSQVTFNNESFFNVTVIIQTPPRKSGSLIRCNGEEILLNNTSTGTFVTQINITVDNNSMLNVVWNSIGSCYFVQNNMMNDRILFQNNFSFSIFNVTNNITISTYSERKKINSTFVTGPCIFYDNNALKRKYILYLNETWIIVQQCNQFTLSYYSICLSNGNWIPNYECPTISSEVTAIIEANVTSTVSVETLIMTSKFSIANNSVSSVLIVIFIVATLVISILLISIISTAGIILRIYRKRISNPRFNHIERNNEQYIEVNSSTNDDYGRQKSKTVTTNYANNSIIHPADEVLNLDTLLIQLKPISADFQIIGGAAGISPETLKKINTLSKASYDGLVEVCDAWLNKCFNDNIRPTWRAIAEILSLIGHSQLSQDIMQVYTTGTLPIQVNECELHGHNEVPSHFTIDKWKGKGSLSPTPPPLPPRIDEHLINHLDKDYKNINLNCSRTSPKPF